VLVGNLTDDIGREGAFDRNDDALELSVEGATAEENSDFVVTSPQGTLTLHPDGSYEFSIDPSQNGLEDGESAVIKIGITATDNGQPIPSDNNTLTVTISACLKSAPQAPASR
jgi:VCBS repeat-containing protein